MWSMVTGLLLVVAGANEDHPVPAFCLIGAGFCLMAAGLLEVIA